MTNQEYHSMNSQRECLNCLEKGDLDMAVEVVKNVKTGSELTNMMDCFLGVNSNVPHFHIEYLLGFINWRLENYIEAKHHFLNAAGGGMFSGYYCAARIVEESQHESNELKGLLLNAASKGHLWSKLRLAKEAAKSASLIAKFQYYFSRVFVAPIQIIVYNANTSKKERIRY